MKFRQKNVMILRSKLFRSCLRAGYYSLKRYAYGFSSIPPKTMKLESERFKSLFTPELNSLSSLFEKYGHELRIAGGAVRDLLMEITPADVDFATTATPDQMHEMFEKESIRTFNKKGEKHGTVTCRINDKENFEITTLRVDVLCDGRRAQVEWTRDWYLDSNRRDLTVNSMFLDLDGTVYDYFNGIKDLENRRLIFVGDALLRIQEDYLRILRYFRFYGRLSKGPEMHDSETLRIIKENACGLANISGERLWVEFRKIVIGNFAGPLVKVMADCDILPYLGLPHNANVEEFYRIWDESKDLSPKPLTLIASLLHDEDEMYSMDSRLKLSSQERFLGLFITIYRKREDEWKTLENKQKYFQDLILDEGGDKNPHSLERVYELLKYMGMRDILEPLKEWQIPKFPVNGYHMATAGMKGPAIKRTLDFLFEIWKESNYSMTVNELLTRVGEAQDSDIPEKRRKSVEKIVPKRKISK